jgi:hypothetical protein
VNGISPMRVPAASSGDTIVGHETGVLRYVILQVAFVCSRRNLGVE